MIALLLLTGIVNYQLVCGPTYDNSVGGRNANCHVVRTVSTPIPPAVKR